MTLNQIRLHNHLAYFEAKPYIIAWNRFKPSPMKFNLDDFDEILSIIDTKPGDVNDSFMSMLKDNFLLSGPDYLEMYENEINNFLEKNRKVTANAVKKQQPFDSVQLFNDECNLKCSYCVMKHTWGEHYKNRYPRLNNPEEVYNSIKDILDIQYDAMEKHGKDQFVFSMNGGEILLQFELIKRVVHYIREEKGDKRSVLTMNTNATLISEKVARFIIENDMQVYVSIDVNRTHHESTRLYHNGKGSYDDVLAAVQRLKEMGYKKDTIRYFQGTVDDFDKVDPDEFADIAQYGFKDARLSPNLLNVPPEEGHHRARKFFKLVKDSPNLDLHVYDNLFQRFKDAVDMGARAKYGPFCNGLGGRVGRALFYNISCNTISYLCQYAVDGVVPLGNPEDVFSLESIEKALEYQETRARNLLKYCSGCPIIGICKGGCVIGGMTSDNEINEASCNYLKTLWVLYLYELQGLDSNKNEQKVTGT